MNPVVAEAVGTILLIIPGDGVVAYVVLSRTKGQNGGWIVITAGWAVAVTVAVNAAKTASGAHLNPAVTLALASTGTFAWGNVPAYLAAQYAWISVRGPIVGGVQGAQLHAVIVQ